MPISPQTNTLSPSELVPDLILRELAQEDPGRAQGELSAVHQAILVMYLPEICGELLARRAADRAEAPRPTPFTNLRHFLPAQMRAGGAPLLHPARATQTRGQQ